MQAGLRAQLDFQYPGWRHSLRWDGDNREFVIECVLPLMTWVTPDVRQVIRWAYGYDGEKQSIEQWSDGTSLVKDKFFDNIAKDPHGVGHDYLHWLSHRRLADPSRRIWTFREAADWYRKASIQFGDGKAWSFWKRFGLDLVAWPVWGPRGRYKETNARVRK
jgi:hypothetical protein